MGARGNVVATSHRNLPLNHQQNDPDPIIRPLFGDKVWAEQP